MDKSQILYLKKKPDGSVACCMDMRTAIELYGSYDTTCTAEEWENGGHFAKVVDGKIVIGKPKEVLKAELEEEFRKARYYYLRECDKISPMRWESMSDEKKQEWKDYRQALLDIPQRPGFPWNGPDDYQFWPKKPE